MKPRVILPTIDNGAAATAGLFSELEMEYLPVPVNRIVPIWDAELQQTARDELDQVDWLFFASANGIEQFFAMIPPDEVPDSVQIAVVGPNTADKVKEYGRTADFVPSEYRGKVLAAQFIAAHAGEHLRCVVVRPLRMGSPLVEELSQAGFATDQYILYTTEPIPREELPSIDFREDDLFVFRSPSGVSAFFSAYSIPAGATAFAIGPATERRLHDNGHEKVLTADNASRHHLVTKIKRYLDVHIADSED